MASFVHTFTSPHDLHNARGIVKARHRNLGGCLQLDAFQFLSLAPDDELVVFLGDLEVNMRLRRGRERGQHEKEREREGGREGEREREGGREGDGRGGREGERERSGCLGLLLPCTQDKKGILMREESEGEGQHKPKEGTKRRQTIQ